MPAIRGESFYKLKRHFYLKSLQDLQLCSLCCLMRGFSTSELKPLREEHQVCLIFAGQVSVLSHVQHNSGLSATLWKCLELQDNKSESTAHKHDLRAENKVFLLSKKISSAEFKFKN